MKILIIDDDPVMLELLAHLLSDMGEVETAVGGVMGLAAAARSIPDLILCDVVMPDVDGLTVCRHLKSHITTKSIPVLCISASINEAEELAALGAGAVDFIKKPISPLLVRARVKTQIELARKSEMLLDLTRRDPLTGIFNRRYFEQRLGEEWARHRRANEPLALAMVDLDNFKGYNDFYGHVKGDECLMTVADCLRESARRPGELAARYGGEEFVLLLPSMTENEVDKFGAWLCRNVRDLEYPHALNESGCVSISVGMAVVVPGEAMRPLDLVKSADKALYVAKTEGRDRYAVQIQ